MRYALFIPSFRVADLVWIADGILPRIDSFAAEFTAACSVLSHHSSHCPKVMILLDGSRHLQYTCENDLTLHKELVLIISL